ncbi:MAG: hypothetical protein LBV74_12445 [Tannerella sp.]|jgi:hypothetical protein|nr:hypothetical protein [Tannerella sp.]
MGYTFKALFTGSVLFFLITFSNFKISAQDHIFPEFVGTWTLDSVQVTEVMPDSTIQKTVLPGQSSKFNDSWMWQFTLDTEGKAAYKQSGNNLISNILYYIKDKSGNAATLIIDGVPDYKILNVQLLSENILLVTQSFSTGYNLHDIDVSWRMHYHK